MPEAEGQLREGVSYVMWNREIVFASFLPIPHPSSFLNALAGFDGLWARNAVNLPCVFGNLGLNSGLGLVRPVHGNITNKANIIVIMELENLALVSGIGQRVGAGATVRIDDDGELNTGMAFDPVMSSASKFDIGKTIS